MAYNKNSLTTLCASLCYAIGVTPPSYAVNFNEDLNAYVDEKMDGGKVDRVFMYNPDAIGEWLYHKYPKLFTEVVEESELELPLKTVMPSVTPVCFGTMYTGAEPSVHGILKYEKPVISIDTVFDALIRQGKKPVIISYGNSSLSKIYLEREMDYFILDTVDEVAAKTTELILEDKYDFYVVYNGNYDSAMHKNGPESVTALSEIKANSRAFATFSALIKEKWQNHDTLMGFAMDHGCHEIDEESGAHGLDMEEDLNILHLYKVLNKRK